MTTPQPLTKIKNWLDNPTIFEIIKDRHRIYIIVQEIDNENGHVNIEILQFVGIFSLYQNLDKQRQVVVKRISQTDDWGLRLKIGEELIAIENEEKQFLKNVLYTAHTFTDIKLQGKIENVAKSFFTGNIEKANELLNPTQLETEQNKVLQLIQAQTKLEQAYDSLEDNANEFRVKAQLTVLNLDTLGAEDRFEKAVFYFERGQISAIATERKPFIGNSVFEYAYFLQKHNQNNKTISFYEAALLIYKHLVKENPQIYSPEISNIYDTEQFGGFIQY
jgi:tRNA G10  N-methylase Trm11